MPKQLIRTETINKKETYYFIDKDGEANQRVRSMHPHIGRYVVRASVLMTEETQAVVCCEWLNKMVEDREFLANGNKSICDLFKVANYKGSLKTFVVVRKLLEHDLVSGMDEFIEVRERGN